MRKASVVLYRYDELNDQAKKVAREWWKDDDGEMGSIHCEDERSCWTAVLKNEYGFEDPDIRYTGFGSQGDGASFTCESIDLQKLISMFPERFSDFRRLFLDIIAKNVRFFIARHDYHYCNEYMVGCDYEADKCFLSNKLDSFLANIAKVIDSIQQSLSRRIYGDLEDVYFNSYSDEYAEERIIANEYEFYLDGHRADFRL